MFADSADSADSADFATIEDAIVDKSVNASSSSSSSSSSSTEEITKPPLSTKYFPANAELIYELYCQSRNNVEVSHKRLMSLAALGSEDYEALAELYMIPLLCRGNQYLQVNVINARAIAVRFVDVLESKECEGENAHNEYLCFIKGVYFDDLKGNYAESFKWYQICADLGNSTGINNLGYCYFVGKGCKRNFKEAVTLYQQAADKGNVLAQANLGYCYYSGKGTTENFSLAVFWFSKAAANGNSFGQNRLGYCYYKGEGVEKNYHEAVRLFLLSADQGGTEAQYYLGDCYYFGRGVEKDFKESIKFYRLSADSGNQDALNEVGNLYYKGEGVQKDRKEAIRMWRISASLDNPWAIKRLKLNNPQFREILDSLEDISTTLSVEKASMTYIPDYLFKSSEFCRTLSIPTDILKKHVVLATVIFCFDSDISLVSAASNILGFM